MKECMYICITVPAVFLPPLALHIIGLSARLVNVKVCVCVCCWRWCLLWSYLCLCSRVCHCCSGSPHYKYITYGTDQLLFSELLPTVTVDAFHYPQMICMWSKSSFFKEMFLAMKCFLHRVIDRVLFSQCSIW